MQTEKERARRVSRKQPKSSDGKDRASKGKEKSQPKLEEESCVCLKSGMQREKERARRVSRKQPKSSDGEILIYQNTKTFDLPIYVSTVGSKEGGSSLRATSSRHQNFILSIAVDHWELSYVILWVGFWFVTQMLDRLAGKEFYCFLDGYSGYNQIAIAPDDQEKTTFTCPYETFAFRRMPFGLCNAPATVQRCMMSIFSDMLEQSMEVFMDDFSVYGTSYENCLQNLERI
ncbi:hypothetical protein OSB04_031769 [Centaurea solstitialis]|uniref:Reverse transcriptase domain-containing protein n=1 Tax=Centaurea solstitialis TaxID=347529 RepID=A0AA38SMB2_9ASTR|nr:hypothetical protein OSB04_031769 [Centaurea solstitialis]